MIKTWWIRGFANLREKAPNSNDVPNMPKRLTPRVSLFFDFTDREAAVFSYASSFSNSSGNSSRLRFRMPLR